MTRKKFVKQLMALGLSRNRANFHAMLCREKGIPYAEHYKAMAPWLGLAAGVKNPAVSIRIACANFASAMDRAAANMKKLSQTIAESKQMELVAHHPEPYTPAASAHQLPQNIQIMSRADHAAMHQGGGGHE